MERKIRIIDILSQRKPNHVTSKDLSASLNVSVRTITNIIKEINDEFGLIIESSYLGYSLVSNVPIPVELISRKNTPFDYESRKLYILERILLKNEHPYCNELADQLFVSASTLNNDLTRIRIELKEDELFIKTKNNQLYIIGSSKARNKKIMELLNNELSNSYFNLQSIQNFFSTVNVKEIESIVSNTLIKYEYFLDDFSLLNYVLHLAICIESKQPCDFDPNHKEQSRFIYTPHIEQIVNEIYYKLKNIYQFTFTQDQIYDASVLMSTRLVTKDLNRITFNQLESFVGSSVTNLLSQIIKGVHDYYGIDLRNDNFMVRFAFHLKNVLVRIKNGISISNNYFESIQDEFPLLYVISAYIASIINQNFSCILPKNEISYIALHIGVLMEEKKASEKISCVLVIIDYLNIASKITSLLSKITNDILIVDIVTSYENIQTLENIDLIITTFKPDPAITNLQVKISSMCTGEDLKSINVAISKVYQQREYNQLKQNLQTFFPKELFFKNSTFTSQQEIIRFSCDTLIENDYASEPFRDQIYEHEKCAPSAYKNIAIPHPLFSEMNYAKKSAVLTLLCENPILWSANKVNLVFMICLTSDDYSYFKEIFSLITYFLTSDTFNSQLKEVETYEEFIDLIIKNAK